MRPKMRQLARQRAGRQLALRSGMRTSKHPQSRPLTVVAILAAAAGAAGLGSCATKPPPQPPQQAQLAQAVAAPEREEPPEQLPGAARALLKMRMASHARDMGDLMS